MVRLLKVTFRNLLKHRKYTIANFIGLVSGFTIAIIIGLFVCSELSYDNFNKNKDNIFRLSADMPVGRTSEINMQVANYLMEDIPEIEKIVLINGGGMYLPDVKNIKYGEKSLTVNDLYYCNADFADVFSYKTLEGNLKQALSTPNSIVLTKSLSEKLFAHEKAVGKCVVVKDNVLLTVGAVLDDIPLNSSFQPKALLSFESSKSISGIDMNKDENWSYDAYFMLNKNITASKLQPKLKNAFTAIMGDNEEAKEIMSQIQLGLIPLNQLYFSEPTSYDSIIHGKKSFMFIMLSIGIAILILAILNFENLTIINGISRAKEFGIKKVNGGGQFTVYLHFVFETVFFCIISYLLALKLAKGLLLPFSNVIGYQLNIDSLYYPAFIIVSALFVILVGIFSGLLPSVIISPTMLISSIKSKNINSNKTKYLQKGLVVFQYSLSIIIVIGMVVVSKQIHFMNNKNVGFDKEKMIEISLADLNTNQSAYLSNIKENANIESITVMNSFFGREDGNSMYCTVKHLGVTMENVPVKWRRIDASFFDVTGVKIKESVDMNAVKEGWILNEAAVKNLKLTNNILETTIDNLPVIAIVQDFNYTSLHSPVTPYFFKYSPNEQFGFLALLRLHATDKETVNQTLGFLKDEWGKVMPTQPFVYTSFKDKYIALNDKENRLKKAMIYFSIVAMIISALGIFILSAFSIQRRTKEIGVRKVNGARTSEILTMLNKDFVKWVVIAFIIASPIAWFAMHKWLENFAYKTTLSWWVFALAGVLALGIALLTVTLQSWRASTKNPVLALRYE